MGILEESERMYEMTEKIRTKGAQNGTKELR